MNTITANTVAAWCQQRSQLLQFFAALNQAHIRWALFSGVTISIIGRRPTNDIDLKIHDDDFLRAAALLPRSTLQYNKTFLVKSADGHHIAAKVHEAVGHCDDTEVQFMRELTSFNCEHHSYSIRLSNLAWQHALQFNVNGIKVYVAQPFDTMAVKAMMQRGAEQAKHDAGDIAQLANAGHVSPDYARRRAAEFQLDARALGFLQRHAGVQLPTEATHSIM